MSSSQGDLLRTAKANVARSPVSSPSGTPKVSTPGPGPGLGGGGLGGSGGLGGGGGAGLSRVASAGATTYLRR